MRITGGRFKGQTLLTPSKGQLEIRPLRSRLRKALFDLLGQDLTGIQVLDLFSGTGALGLESLSRGAELVIFVDLNPESLKLINKNLERLNLKEKAKVLRLRLPEEIKKLLILGREVFALVFITPPYRKGLAQKTLEALPQEVLAPQALVVVEEESSVNLPSRVGALILEEKRTYGETSFFFYRKI